MVPLLALLLVGLPARQTIDLDGGWQFVRLKRPPSIWNGPDAVPTSTWKVLRVSSQESAAENARASRAFDGDPNTIWHTEWSRRQAPYPHEIAIDLGSRTRAVGIRLLPRQTGPQNGRPNHFRLYLTDDPSQDAPPVFSGEVPDSSALYQARFPAATGRYLRLVFPDGHRPGEPFLALAEIGLIRETSQKDRKDWQSQYDIATVQTGDARFDLSDSQIDALRKSETRDLSGADWRPATLPHAAWIRPLNDPAIWQGVAYYRRRLSPPPGTAGKRIELTLDGAMQSADLWLNGRHLAARRGGYLPLIVDLTGKLRSDNEILVRVDNSDNPLIPPGKPQAQLDFMYGAGLYRNARLTVTDRLYVTDPLTEDIPYGGGIYVVYPEVSAAHALVRVRTHVRNATGSAQRFLLRQILRTSAGNAVATSQTAVRLGKGAARAWMQDLSVAKPRLWFPDSPNLYRLETDLVQGGRIVDRATTRIGIRKVEVSRARGFVLNGRPIRLVGTNRHQDYPWVGPALSDAANARDALLIKRAGHNIVRLSHYPQSPAFLDACDELGVMTIPCIPGWQFMNQDPRFVARVRRDIRDLIRRDRNHPSAVFWEASLNETYPPAAIARDWYATAKSEALAGNILTGGDGTQGAPWDVVYNQWKEDLSRPQNAVPDKPGYIREYGDYEFGGATSSSRVRIGAGVGKLLQETWNHVWSYNKFRPQYPWTMGAGTWEMFDHNVPWEFAVSASGLADLFRREKPSFWFYQIQTAPTPFLKVAGDWQPGAPSRTLVAFTNCDAVALYVNGRRVREARPERGPETPYEQAKPWDGSNTKNLAHPPIVFRDVPFEAGTVKVVGLVRNRPLAGDTLRTAGKPVRLRVWLDDLGIRPTANDLVFVRAAVVDANGTVCPHESRRIRFRVAGATLAGEPTAPAEMGVASTLVRTPLRAGRVEVSARDASGLAGSCTFRFGRP